jgi:mRNA-degrading endonuclease RelE of RelBE toxin-antitoxin system
MSYRIEVTSFFAKQLKRLIKKYPSLKLVYALLIQSLHKNPNQGVLIRRGCYKILIPIASEGKGKSVGARAITHIQVMSSKIYLLSIYDKPEQSTISDKDLDNLPDTLS